MKTTRQKKPSNSTKDYEQLGRMLSNIYETGYIDRNEAYKNSFIKGVFSGLGGVIGATIVVALLLWILSLFGQVPLIGRFFETAKHTISSH